MSKISTPRVRKHRRKNPVRYAYMNLKHNAKRRGKYFDLTFEQFYKFCKEVNLLDGKRNHKNSYTVDRIDNEKGYTISNIQRLTRSENSKKGTKILDYDPLTKTARYIEMKEDLDDLPF